MSELAHKNEVHLAGVLGKDPLIRYTPSSKQVATLTLVTRYKDKSEFHRVVAWEDLAKKVEDLHKGDFLRIVGRLQTRSWEDAAKVKHYATEVIAFQVVVPADEPTPPPPGGKAIAESILRPSANNPNIHGLTVTEDDLPF